MSQTLQRLMAQGVAVLREAGVDSPDLDARLLALETLHLTHAQVLANYDECVPTPLAAEFLGLVRRRAAREPLAYVLGHADFYGRCFLCDRRALVPRPETELLVESALAFCRELGPETVIADVGLGTGVVGITLALECPQAVVWGTEISPSALQVARANAAFHHLNGRMRMAEGSLLQPLVETGVADQVGVVVSNPPYVRSEELKTLQPEVSVWEPRLALDGGPEGLDLYEGLLAECAELPRLQAVFLEVGYDTAEPVCALARRTWPEAETQLLPDLAGLPRVVALRLPQAAATGEAPARAAVEAG
jgi:release factor glutamine methyltransferase